MDRIILKIESGLSLDKAHTLAEIVAKSILNQLKLKKISLMAGFKLWPSEPTVLEVRRSDLALLLPDDGLPFSRHEKLKLIDAAINNTLSDLHIPLQSSRLGTNIINRVGSPERERQVLLDCMGSRVVLVIPKQKMAELSDRKARGIFAINTLDRSFTRCELICMKSNMRTHADIKCGSDQKDQLSQSFINRRYVYLSGAAIYIGDKIKKDSFVVEQCLGAFNDADIHQLIQTNQFERYFCSEV